MANLKRIINPKNLFYMDLTKGEEIYKLEVDDFSNDMVDVFFYNIDLSPSSLKKRAKDKKEGLSELEKITEDERTFFDNYKERTLKKDNSHKFDNLISSLFQKEIKETDEFLKDKKDIETLFKKKIKPVLVVKKAEDKYLVLISFWNFWSLLKGTWIKMPLNELIKNQEWEIDNFLFYDKNNQKMYSVLGEEDFKEFPIAKEDTEEGEE